ncbi:MAG: glycoside hydrolase family 9 protein [Flavobacteriaceae bacterium]|nr:glycoside hydrolase family 9 protein [Flavobacteriaceae bacterium]
MNSIIIKYFYILGSFFFVIPYSYSQLSEDIRLNQGGYFEQGKKIISVKTDTGGVFYIKSPDLSSTYYSGTFSSPNYWEFSGENIATIDITAFNTLGEFVIQIPAIGYSHIFNINQLIGLDPLSKSLKAYYYMRCSSPVLPVYGEDWVRNEGHLDTNIVIHQSAASTNRPEGTIIASPKGWYDAGDYNKYIVNSGISTYTLLAAYEQYATLFNNLNSNIPESGNNIPDILDEIKWNLDWMLTMQDPDDGGVYFKLTNESFDGIVMPENGQSTPRYVIQKTTSSALNFAAVMATASRVFSQFDTTYSSQCLTAAQSAWNWANANPNIIYNQNTHNSLYNPNIYTGAYEDDYMSDEFIWAATELYITTMDDNYYITIDWTNFSSWFVPSWPHVDFLAIYSLLLHQDNLSAIGLNDIPFLQAKLLDRADNLRTHYETQSAHKVTMGDLNEDFTWGSNGVASNQGILLVKAFHITEDSTYLDAAISSFDYILGRNATNYCFVTGLGDKSPQNPHHRPSQADAVAAPIPGMVVGGPQNYTNPDEGSSCVYPAQEQANKYIDEWCSYSTNEITINWNAPFVFLSAALQDYFLFGDYTILSINDETLNDFISIYPNPTKNTFTINLKNETLEKAFIYNQLGQQVKEITTNEVNISNLHKGIYFVKITLQSGEITVKKVIKK